MKKKQTTNERSWSEEYARQQCQKMEERKEFWEETREIAAVLMGIVAIGGLVALLMWGVLNALQWIDDQSHLRGEVKELFSRVDVLEQKSAPSQYRYVISNWSTSSLVITNVVTETYQ